MNHNIVIVQPHPERDPFERQVEGLIEMCKYLATATPAEKGIINFMQFDEFVVKEAQKRVLKDKVC